MRCVIDKTDLCHIFNGVMLFFGGGVDFCRHKKGENYSVVSPLVIPKVQICAWQPDAPGVPTSPQLGELEGATNTAWSAS